MAEFTANGVLANLSELGYSFDDDVIPATTSICKSGEDIYLAPYYGNVTVLMYNKQLVEAAGYAPEDIDSFADIMDIASKTRAADPDKNGFLIRGGSPDNIPVSYTHLDVYKRQGLDRAGRGVPPEDHRLIRIQIHGSVK